MMLLTPEQEQCIKEAMNLLRSIARENNSNLSDSGKMYNLLMLARENLQEAKEFKADAWKRHREEKRSHAVIAGLKDEIKELKEEMRYVREEVAGCNS